jgi:hypothetical protein
MAAAEREYQRHMEQADFDKLNVLYVTCITAFVAEQLRVKQRLPAVL